MPDNAAELSDVDRRVVRSAAEWACSPEGQAAFAKALDDAEEKIEALQEARRLDPETLRKPMTI